MFVIADDPVRARCAASLARPGGLMTGLTSLSIGLDAKRLEILKMANSWSTSRPPTLWGYRSPPSCWRGRTG